MHSSSIFFGKIFFRNYDKGGGSILDIGSKNFEGSLKDFITTDSKYTGVDFDEGPGVDVVLTDPYSLPFPDDHFDIVTASSCLEHSEFFWVSFEEMVRVLKPGGYIYINSPSNGDFHRYPVDCWRFYPDSGIALQNWARRQGHPLTLVESFIAETMDSIYNDFVAVFVKSQQDYGKLPRRITQDFKKYTNGRTGFDESISNHYSISPDQRRMTVRYWLRRLNYIGKNFR